MELFFFFVEGGGCYLVLEIQSIQSSNKNRGGAYIFIKLNREKYFSSFFLPSDMV